MTLLYFTVQVQTLLNRIEELKAKDLVPAFDESTTKVGDPSNFGGVWTTGWC